MKKENAIIEMLKLLEKNNIFSTQEFKKDILKLVNTNTNKFIKNFYKDIRRKNFEDYNRFEVLQISNKQKRLLNGKNLYRYEYRENSNLKCIYIIETENNMEEIILLSAFNEDGDKKRGKNSYNDNIERAIRIYLSII